MARMSNQAYLSVRCRDFREESILPRLAAFLETVPFSSTKPGFTYFTLRALDESQPPILEQDFRIMPLDAAGIVAIAAEQLHGDCSYEVSCFWDLATFDAGTGKSKSEPQAIEIICRGEDYDDGFWRERGHFEVQLGFEHFFTGHAGLLGMRGNGEAVAESAEEARFLEAMAWPENLDIYQERTRGNIRKLLEWVRRIEKAVPVERSWLWSEGEENFEACLERIVAAR
jgi:hypothetical protein